MSSIRSHHEMHCKMENKSHMCIRNIDIMIYILNNILENYFYEDYYIKHRNIYIYLLSLFIFFLQNTTLWRWLFSQCSSLLTNLLSMRWRYSYLRIKYRRILSHHAPHHSSRHRIDIAMSPASRTEVPRGGGRPPQKNNWRP